MVCFHWLLLYCCCFCFCFGWFGTGSAESHCTDMIMIHLHRCMAGPVYPLNERRPVSRSCICAGHEGGHAQEGTMSVCSTSERKKKCGCNRYLLFFFLFCFFSGGAENDVVDGPCVQIHQFWSSVTDSRGLLHQTGRKAKVLNILQH